MSEDGIGAAQSFRACSTWLTRGRVGRWFNEKLFGIDRRRMPPALARMSWMSAQSASKLTVENDGSSVEEPSLPHRGKVLLFPDTFMNYCEPDLGRHMREFLAHLQCDVEIDCTDLEYLDPQPHLLRPAVHLQWHARPGRCRGPT